MNKRLKDLFYISAGGDISSISTSDEKNNEFIYPVYSNALKNDGLYCYSNNYRIRKEALTITARGNIGFSFLREPKFNAIGRLLVLIPKNNKFNIKYINYILSKNNIIYNKTAIPQLTSIDIGDKIIPIYHSLDIQNKVVLFLDENCSKIDTEISLLEKKSKLLEEYKQSLIFETVTKGLDKNAEMKDSGIDWIGEIPKHWNVKRIKNIYKLGMGSIILKEDLIEEGKYPVYSATAEDKFFGKVNKINILLKKGDLVIPARGSIGFVKKINIEEFCTCTQTTIYAKNRSKEYTDYYYYYLLGNKKNIFSYDNTAIPQITVSQINGKNLLVPPIVEQEKISIFLNEKIFSINKNIELINKKVELLKEYKQSLIYEAVTGQLDIE